jgi:peptidyl-prolyl cis-trans isomerase D
MTPRAFGLSPGQPSDLRDLADQGYYMVKLDRLTPAQPQPLTEIRDKVTRAWQDSERQARLAKLAQDMAAAIGKGQTLGDVAGMHGLKTFTTRPLSRDNASDGLSPLVTAKLFGAKLGQAVSGPAQGDGGGEIVAVVTQILPPDPANETRQKAAIAAEIQQSARSDLLSQFEQALRRRYPVSVDRAALNRLL